MMSSKLLAIGLLASSMITAPAFAAVDITGSLTVAQYTGTNNGLTINIDNIAAIGPFTLGSTPQSFDLFTISTPENSVEWGEDTLQKVIQVTFGFTNPTDVTGAPITGTTSGDTSWFGFFQNGQVVWDAPQVFSFGNGGQFQIALNDATFNEGAFWGLGNVGAQISGTFTLLNDSTPAVPEPATWAMLIAGFGLVGAAMRRRQKVNVTYA